MAISKFKSRMFSKKNTNSNNNSNTKQNYVNKTNKRILKKRSMMISMRGGGRIKDFFTSKNKNKPTSPFHKNKTFIHSHPNKDVVEKYIKDMEIYYRNKAMQPKTYSIPMEPNTIINTGNNMYSIPYNNKGKHTQPNTNTHVDKITYIMPYNSTNYTNVSHGNRIFRIPYNNKKKYNSVRQGKQNVLIPRDYVTITQASQDNKKKVEEYVTKKMKQVTQTIQQKLKNNFNLITNANEILKIQGNVFQKNDRINVNNIENLTISNDQIYYTDPSTKEPFLIKLNTDLSKETKATILKGIISNKLRYQLIDSPNDTNKLNPLFIQLRKYFDDKNPKNAKQMMMNYLTKNMPNIISKYKAAETEYQNVKTKVKQSLQSNKTNNLKIMKLQNYLKYLTLEEIDSIGNSTKLSQKLSPAININKTYTLLKDARSQKVINTLVAKIANDSPTSSTMISLNIKNNDDKDEIVKHTLKQNTVIKKLIETLETPTTDDDIKKVFIDLKQEFQETVNTPEGADKMMRAFLNIFPTSKAKNYIKIYNKLFPEENLYAGITNAMTVNVSTKDNLYSVAINVSEPVLKHRLRKQFFTDFKTKLQNVSGTEKDNPEIQQLFIKFGQYIAAENPKNARELVEAYFLQYYPTKAESYMNIYKAAENSYTTNKKKLIQILNTKNIDKQVELLTNLLPFLISNNPDPDEILRTLSIEVTEENKKTITNIFEQKKNI